MILVILIFTDLLIPHISAAKQFNAKNRLSKSLQSVTSHTSGENEEKSTLHKCVLWFAMIKILRTSRFEALAFPPEMKFMVGVTCRKTMNLFLHVQQIDCKSHYSLHEIPNVVISQILCKHCLPVCNFSQ